MLIALRIVFLEMLLDVREPRWSDFDSSAIFQHNTQITTTICEVKLFAMRSILGSVGSRSQGRLERYRRHRDKATTTGQSSKSTNATATVESK
jgi:hypothetical protein